MLLLKELRGQLGKKRERGMKNVKDGKAKGEIMDEFQDLVDQANQNPGVREVMEAYASVQSILSQASPFLGGYQEPILSVSDHTRSE